MSAASRCIRKNRAISSCIDALEFRRLLSGAAPMAANDTFTAYEDTPLVVEAGESSLMLITPAGQRAFTPSNGHFSALSNDRNGVSIIFDSKTNYYDDWRLDFASADDSPLAPGTYTDARRYSSYGDAPGLSVYNDYPFEEETTGQFEVTQAEYSSDGMIESFAADFEQRYSDSSSYVYGSVQYHYLPDGALPGVMWNDKDTDGDSLTASVVKKPGHGLLFLKPDGTFSYVPAADFNGEDSFTYRLFDGTNYSQPATVTIHVVPVNDQPSFDVTDADLEVFDDAGAQSVHLVEQISAGPADEASQLLEFEVYCNSSYFIGTPTLDTATGILSFTIAPNAGGTETPIDLVLKDNGGTSNGGEDTSGEYSCWISITHRNDAPVAKDDSFTVPGNQQLKVAFGAAESSFTIKGDGVHFQGSKTWKPTEIPFHIGEDGSRLTQSIGDGYYEEIGWEASFFAPEGQSLHEGTYEGVSYPIDEYGNAGILVREYGTSLLSTFGSFTIQQLVHDQEGYVLRFAATFEQYADGVATPTTGVVKYNYRKPVGLLANDQDADGDVLRVRLIKAPAHGTLKLNSDGTFAYTPNADYVGPDSFTYVASDDQSDSNVATVNLSIMKPTLPKGIGGLLFNDANANGKQDAGETGLSGWTLYIDTDKDCVKDANEKTATTDANGRYLFSGLAAGSYRIRESVKSGWRRTTGSYFDVAYAANAAVSGKNFGNTQRVLISGTVFADKNANKLKDSGESGLSGWKVYIDADNDGKLDSNERSATSDASGNWSFGDLVAGTYKIRIVSQSAYKTTTASSMSITLSNGQSKTGQLFGEQKIA